MDVTWPWLSTYEPSCCDRNEQAALKANLFTPSSLNLALMLCRSALISGWWWWSQIGQRRVATANEFKLKPNFFASTNVFLLCFSALISGRWWLWAWAQTQLLCFSFAPHQWPWFSTFAMNNGNREHVSVCKSAPPPHCVDSTPKLSRWCFVSSSCPARSF